MMLILLTNLGAMTICRKEIKMSPDWWIEAWEACAELYEEKWETMSDCERDEAISDYVLGNGEY